MENDLLSQLLDLWISRKNVPDILSVEWPDEDPIIRFEWFSGRFKDFGYTRERYDLVWRTFNQYWASQE